MKPVGNVRAVGANLLNRNSEIPGDNIACFAALPGIVRALDSI